MFVRVIAVQLFVALALVFALIYTNSGDTKSLFRRQGDFLGAAHTLVDDLISGFPHTPTSTSASSTTTSSSSAHSTTSSIPSSTTHTSTSRTSSSSRTSTSSSSRTSSTSSKPTTHSSTKPTITSHSTTKASTSIPRTTVHGTYVVTKITTKNGTRLAQTLTSTGNHVVTGTAALVSSGSGSGGHGLTSNDKKIIGGVVGGIGGAALLGGLLLLYFKMRNRKHNYDDDDDLMDPKAPTYYDTPSAIGEANTNGLERYASRSGTTPTSAPSSVPVSANF